MFISDEVVDKLVERDEELQAVVQGRKVMLWRPGQTVGIAVQASLTLGWIGTSLGLFWLSKPSVQTFVYYILGALVVAAPINYLNYRMIRGWPAARTHIYRFSLAMVILAGLAVATCLLGGNTVASILAGADSCSILWRCV